MADKRTMIPIIQPRDPLKRLLYAIRRRKEGREYIKTVDVTFGSTASSGETPDVGDYVDSIAKSGETGLKGDVTLSEGTRGIALTQAGQDIAITCDADHAAISANDGATDVTGTELEELSDGSSTTLHTHAGSTDEKVKVSADDTVADYLINKIVGGLGITVTESGGPGDEDFNIAAGFPGSATDNALARFHTASGEAIQNSGGVLDDNDRLSLTGVTQSDPPRCRAYLSGNQLNLTNNTWTKVALNAESYDSGGIFDSSVNYRCTPDVAGYYQVNVAVNFVGSSVVADKRYAVGIFKNGTRVADSHVHASLVTAIGANLSDIIHCNGSTDYIELYALSVAGVNTVDITGQSYSTFMSVHKIS